MIRIILKIVMVLFAFFAVIVLSVTTVVDTTPYAQKAFYQEMDQRLDSLEQNLVIQSDSSQLQVAWAEVNITPNELLPLAGYGARDPKLMEGILDSSYVRTIVFQLGERKAAIVTADLLIIHPELRNAVFQSLPEGWSPDEVYFTATHTHSGQGGWAPGVVGELFAGSFHQDELDFLSQNISYSIEVAYGKLKPGIVQFGELSLDNLVRNRLVKDKGIVDPWLKVARIQQDTLIGQLISFSAHATCYGAANHRLTSDYPARLVASLNNTFDFTAFAAGAVGSMAVNVSGETPKEVANALAAELTEQTQLLSLIGMSQQPPQTLASFRLRLPLRDPYVKLTNRLALRPYLFENAFGNYSNDINVMVLGQAIFVGLPCDFSGELAVPLYEEARALGYQLFITSFNGGYAGYVIKDEWYDLNKYEARTMSWYGPDTGSYLSEIVSRLIRTIHENSQTNLAHR